jgi:hypothetical protein
MSVNWSVANLNPSAIAASASRRTDLPALLPEWFSQRLDAGEVEYIPAGPPRRIRRSIRPEDITHFNFWSKWPRPFFPVLKKVLGIGYPVLWNVTVTGLGATSVEPGVPPADKAVEAILELSEIVAPSAIQWRYDPIFTSERYGIAHHEAMFRGLAGRLVGRVDRVAVSFVTPFPRRVAPKLKVYGATTGDRFCSPTAYEQTDILSRLREIAREEGLRFTLCCSGDLRDATGCESSGCNSWAWAVRVYPELSGRRPPAGRGKGSGCTCNKEFDIGVYDTCTLGCVYSYGTCRRDLARRNLAAHDPSAPCVLSDGRPSAGKPRV